MQRFPVANTLKQESVLATNSVIRNTYILLAMTLVFSAGAAFVALAVNARPMPFLPMILGFFGLQWLIHKTCNSVWGIVSTFAFTGFLGYTLGPIVGFYLQLSNGPQIVTAALGLTGAIFFALSGYAMVTRKDFNYLAGFLMAGAMIAFIASMLGIFFHIPALHLAVSSVFVLISAGFILFETSAIINGGQRNYILATISLYVSLYNLFLSLLHILGALSGRNN